MCEVFLGIVTPGFHSEKRSCPFDKNMVIILKNRRDVFMNIKQRRFFVRKRKMELCPHVAQLHS